MNFAKLLIGSIAGAVTTFILGWIIFGMLLMDFMNSHPGLAGNIGKAEPDYLYLIIGNVAAGLMFSYIFLKASINSLGSGFINGGIIGLLMSVANNCIWYSTSTALSKMSMAADVAGTTVMFAISGAVIGLVLGMGKKQI